MFILRAQTGHHEAKSQTIVHECFELSFYHPQTTSRLYRSSLLTLMLEFGRRFRSSTSRPRHPGHELFLLLTTSGRTRIGTTVSVKCACRASPRRAYFGITPTVTVPWLTTDLRQVGMHVLFHCSPLVFSLPQSKGNVDVGAERRNQRARSLPIHRRSR